MSEGVTGGESVGQAMVVREQGVLGPATLAEVKQQVQLIQQIMREVMQGPTKDNPSGTHYGVVPGTDKPTLLQPGAQKLMLTFRLRAILNPDSDVRIVELADGHREVRAFVHVCNSAGEELSTGVGSCSTMEAKYRWRGGEKKPLDPPVPVPKEYWNERKDGAPREKLDALLGGSGRAPSKIDGQWLVCEIGEKMENPSIADTYNTVLKMAVKRATVHGVLAATAASDIFTQDVEDMPPEQLGSVHRQTEQKAEPTPDTPRRTSEPATAQQETAAPLQREDGKLVLSGVYLDAVSSKSGKTGTRAWTKYGLKVGEAWYSTFEREVGEAAMAAKAGGTRVTLVYEPDAKGYLNIVSLHDGEPGPLESLMSDDEPIPPSGKGDDIDPELGF